MVVTLELHLSVIKGKSIKSVLRILIYQHVKLWMISKT